MLCMSYHLSFDMSEGICDAHLYFERTSIPCAYFVLLHGTLRILGVRPLMNQNLTVMSQVCLLCFRWNLVGLVSALNHTLFMTQFKWAYL